MSEKNLSDYNSIDEVEENFSPDELLTLAKQKLLEEWLETNFYTAESQQIADAVDNQSSDAELKLIICKIFNFDFDKLSEDDAEEIAKCVAKNQRRELFFDKRDDGKKAAFVETQGELVRELKNGAEVIFLYGGEFKIPYNLHGKTYIGRNNAVIDFTDDADIDFDERDIVFEDLQIFIHHPVNLRIEKSKNVKIINGGRQTLEDRPTLKEIFDIMRGRNPFESAEDFTQRAENIRGAAVGTTLLKDENYFYDETKFDIAPKWNFQYISVLKGYVDGRIFSVNLSPEDARRLYENERKLQIFADFTCIDGKLTILNLYFETETLGRIFIESVLRKLQGIEKISSGSGIFALGYGLELITDYTN